MMPPERRGGDTTWAGRPTLQSIAISNFEDRTGRIARMQNVGIVVELVQFVVGKPKPARLRGPKTCVDGFHTSLMMPRSTASEMVDFFT